MIATLLNDLFVFINAALVAIAGRRFGKLLMNFDFVAGLRLLGDEVHNGLNLVVGDERTLGAN
jgi:hypothetical protein